MGLGVGCCCDGGGVRATQSIVQRSFERIMDLAPLVNALHGTTLAHAGARREAEAQLEAMARVGGYGYVLDRCLLALTALPWQRRLGAGGGG